MKLNIPELNQVIELKDFSDTDKILYLKKHFKITIDTIAYYIKDDTIYNAVYIVELPAELKSYSKTELTYIPIYTHPKNKSAYFKRVNKFECMNRTYTYKGILTEC